MKWLLAAIIGTTLVQAAPQDAGLPSARDIPPAERLWLVTIAQGSNEPFPEEARQVAGACGDLNLVSGLTADTYYACRAKYIKPARYRIAQVHEAPSGSSPLVASLFEERRVASNNQLEFDWTFELASRPGERLAWPESRFAFDYGLHISGAHRRGNWVRLLSSVPVDGWLRISPDRGPASVHVWVSPLPGEIIGLSPLLATWPDGRRRRIARGASYRVKSVSKTGTVRFRAEIPSDFPCGERVTDPVPLPPTLRAEAAEFFNPNGSARFGTVYTKGC